MEASNWHLILWPQAAVFRLPAVLAAIKGFTFFLESAAGAAVQIAELLTAEGRVT